MNSGEMKQTNSNVQQDMAYGQRVMIVTTPDADMKGNVDYIIGSLCVAHRRRRFKSTTYGEVSIRNSRASGAKTEKQKILDSECKAQLFIWEFLDAWIICALSDIADALRRDVGYSKTNNDGITSAYYIPINTVRHFRICKGVPNL